MCICYTVGGYRVPGEEEIVYGFQAIGDVLSNVFFAFGDTLESGKIFKTT